MKALAGESLLTAYDRGIGEHPLQRALTLLELASPQTGRAALAALPIVERDRRLLQLRALSFGATLDAYARCPQCGESMEFGISADALLDTPGGTSDSDGVEWCEAGRRLRMRPATTLDLLAIRDADSDDDACAMLLSRCMSAESETERDEGADATDEPPALAGTALAHFERLHEATQWRCDVACPHCAAHTALELDLVQFLWLEVRDAARRLLDEIHTLAHHYGWSENAITAMNAARRRAYLDLIAGETA